MLTAEQVQAARQKLGITPPADPAVAAADPAKRVAALDSAWGTEPDTVAMKKEPFKSPLTRIATGRSQENLDVGKGAAKQALKDFSSAGAQNAGPVGAAMKENAGGFFDPLEEVTKPTNAAQKEGALNTTIAEIALPAPKVTKEVVKGATAAVDAAKGLGGTEIEKLTKALTPTLTPTKILKGTNEAAKGGEVFDAGAMESVKRSVSAVQNVANILGKKVTDIIKPGTAKANENAARLGQAVGEYAKNTVTPFLQKSGVNYNFTDLKKAIELAKPSEALGGESLATYNKVRQRIIATIANHVGPETKNIRTVSDLRKAAEGTGEVAAKVMKGDVSFWDARKIIDQIVEEETKGKAWGDATVLGAKAAYKDMRTAFAQYLTEAFRYPGQMEQLNKANEFLKSERVMKMDKTGWNLDQFEHQFGLTRNPATESAAAEWEKHMQNMSGLYDGISNITTRAAKEYNKSWLTIFAKEHPTLIKGAEITAGAVGLGALFGFGQNLAN